MKHKVGQLVIKRKLGLGKVLEVRGESVTVFFKDQKDDPRIINVGVVPMTLAEDQSDPYFDTVKLPKQRGRGKMPAAASQPTRPAG